MKNLGVFQVVGPLMLALLACSSTPALYCDEGQPCTAGHPVCDLEGVCAASDFITNTCIPEACWDAGQPPDAPMPPDASMQPDASIPDARADAGAPDANVDAANLPDAAPGTGFDVVYAGTIEIGPSTQFGVFTGQLVVINKGTTPLQIATLEVSVAAQPGESLSFAFTEENHGGGAVVLNQDEAFGNLDAAQLQAMVPETVVATGNIAKVLVSNVPVPDPGTRPRTVTGALGLVTVNGKTAVLPLDVLLRTGSSGSSPAGWRRVSTP